MTGMRFTAHAEPLFKNLKEKFGITHFYFILPDGHCFLRLHDKKLYGDMINRHTFLKARETQALATGIELGKTAFALRAVMPYSYGGKLIGYVELGEEIDHFLGILKEQTGEEYAIIAHKNRLDRGDWKSVRNASGLRDNWDDMENSLLVSQTSNGKLLEKCIDAGSIQKVEKGEYAWRSFRDESGSYTCSGFGLKDAAGKQVGAVLLPLNITRFTSSLEKIKNRTIIFVGIVFLVSTLGILIFSATITRPLSSLENTTKLLADGKFGIIIDIKSHDEIGMLAESFNKMAVSLQTGIASLEQDIAERRKVEEKLRQVSSELEDKNNKLQSALAEVKQLSGMLPICSYCKKIRADNGHWDDVAVYITQHSEAFFSHGACPECAARVTEEFEQDRKREDH